MAITKLTMSGLLPGSYNKYDDFLAGNPAYYPPSFESIATATGTGSSNTITFSSIPSGYKSLQIRFIGKTSSGGAASIGSMRFAFNSDSATNYTNHYLRGNGTAAAAAGTASATSIAPNVSMIPNSASALANMHGVGIIDIIDYTSTTKAKTLRGFIGLDTNAAVASCPIALVSGLWFATPAAITTIDIINAVSNWTTTSTFALYGIK